MKLAFVYAGQGSQRVGMGEDFYHQYPEFREVFDSAPVEFDLKRLCFHGPEEQLKQTRYTQPCMLAFAIGVTRVLYRRGITPDCVAGLSLGEYSALYAAGVFSAEDAIKTVAIRGRAMEQAAGTTPCGMYAVLGLERERLQQACQQAASLGVVEICNYNCPGQLVIGGERDAADRAAELAKGMGAKGCLPLKVSGPFHTSLMAPAGAVLREHFKTLRFQPMERPVFFNCTGSELGAEDTIPALLARQVSSPVYFEDIIQTMKAAGVEHVVEIGPGNTLSGFFRKTAPAIKRHCIDTAADLERLVSDWKGELA